MYLSTSLQIDLHNILTTAHVCKWSTERSKNLPRVTQLLVKRVSTQTQTVCVHFCSKACLRFVTCAVFFHLLISFIAATHAHSKYFEKFKWLHSEYNFLFTPSYGHLILLPRSNRCCLCLLPETAYAFIRNMNIFVFSLFMLTIAYSFSLWFFFSPLNNISLRLTLEPPFYCYMVSVCQDTPIRCSVNYTIESSTIENLEVMWSSVLPDIISWLSRYNPILDNSILIAMPYDLVSRESSCYTRQFLFLSTSSFEATL